MKDRALPLFVIPMLLAPLAATSPQAGAQSINRCEAPDGTTIFTDKSCAAFGATASGQVGYDDGAATGELRDPPETLGAHGAIGGFAIKGCARTQGELIAGVRGAIESGDVNRLTNYYHWTGVSSSASVDLLDRLDKVVRNTLSGVQFDYAPTFDYSTAAIHAGRAAPASAADDSAFRAAYATQVAYQSHPAYAAHPAYPEPSSHDAHPANRQAASYAPDAHEATATRPMPVADVTYAAGPSYMDRFRPENDDVPILSSGIADASTPLEAVLPEIRDRLAAAEGADAPQPVAVSGAMVDASTPLDEARAMTIGGGSMGYPESHANPKPVALRVNNGGGGGTRFSLRQNAGCWFLQF